MGNNNSSPPPPPPTAPPTPALSMSPGATLLTDSVGENGALTLNCGSSMLEISRVIFASYGLPNGSGLGAKFGACYAGSSQSVVTNKCVGKQSCSVAASNSVFGDPCVGTVKRLTVTAECTAVPSYQTYASVAEHQTLKLQCANGYVITKVDYASYGKPNGYTNGWCHAGSSVDVLTKLCVGQASCNVPAENCIFTDPCVGTFKDLAAKVTCGLGTAPQAISTPFIVPSCNTP
ncbi:hypothetical protein SPRG_07182 [Saprolegnia parasitica CBS 223.65]|uniref:SUEL-type lectin domain-containing protein n=1 Tax=Saprolegnia parasitica (strain CBS 223.65) TaxID=695850 RepID=A0A067CAW2_SAPPC|nr:hypothetical protein SPRG_07182 [Saprolegnia parasitica CBS 223.65]KDO27909.1 hypothetical protein SPRG_07182 [Saprolegnia parasitica CBS 223.65]|eukprot:XP_012201366.1 hypothetical protein SPRG_07182 [Saprolegnia parasitica CBS 223.65]